MESEISGRPVTTSTVARLPPRAQNRRTGWNDLSRMKGNFHVRFSGECGRGNPPALTRRSRAKVVRRIVDDGWITIVSMTRLWWELSPARPKISVLSVQV